MKRFVVIVVAVLAVAGIAQAAIPDAAGVIHGCYRTSNPAPGALIVIDSEAGQTCPSGTVPLNWNQAGPAGPAGPQGPAGSQGYQVLTQRANTLDIRSDVSQGRSMGAPAGKVIVSAGYLYLNPPAGQPLGLQVQFSFTQPSGTTHSWGFVCTASVPCEVDMYIVVIDLTP